MNRDQFDQYLVYKYDWIKNNLAKNATLYFWNGEESIPIYSIDYIQLWYNAITFNETDDLDNAVPITETTINGKLNGVPIILEAPDSFKEFHRELLSRNHYKGEEA